MSYFGTYENLAANNYYTEAKAGAMIMESSDRKGDYIDNGKMKVIFQFPGKSEMDEMIKKEINAIMHATLKEQLHNKNISM